MSELSMDSHYDTALHLVLIPWKDPGYHSKLKDGVKVHQTRASADYALECLMAGDSKHQERAGAIIDRLCELQDTDPISHTYGIWSWTYEESLAQMNPPDWNWADFIGVRLAQAVKLYPDRLPTETIRRARAAILHAAWSIFRRNVTPDYTNIAIMGAVCTAAAGELMGVPLLVDYARRRLIGVGESIKKHGGFTEYNSPTYTAVAVEELDRLRLVVDDPVCRQYAEPLWCHAWQVVADHFHPATQQWAGPHGRAYTDTLTEMTTRWLSRATGLDIRPVTPGGVEQTLVLVPPRACPADLIGRFQKLPEPEVTVVQQFIQRVGDSTTGTTWMNDSACLASVNRECTWVQRRFLLGYWKTREDVAILKMSVLMNGREFPGFTVRQQQERTRVLTSLYPVFGTGDYHPFLGAVADGRFTVSDLRIRYELKSACATGECQEGGGFILSAGPWRAVVRPTPGLFAGAPITWSVAKLKDAVCVDGLMYAGAPKVIDFTHLTMQAGIGLELVKPSANAFAGAISLNVDEKGIAQVRWGDLAVATPASSRPFEW